jgi:hypothetical protein
VDGGVGLLGVEGVLALDELSLEVDVLADDALSPDGVVDSDFAASGFASAFLALLLPEYRSEYQPLPFKMKPVPLEI